MSITAIIFLIGFAVAAVLALTRHPAWGLWLYLWTYYNDPSTRWWGPQVPDLRWSLVAAVIAGVAVVRFRHDTSTRPAWHANWGARMLVLYVVWTWIQALWAVNVENHIEGAVLFTKFLALYIVIYEVTSEEWGFDTFATAHILGCAILGWFALSFTTGGRIEGIGPPNADDADTVAAQLLTGLIFCGFYFFASRGKLVRRLAICLAVPFILNTIVLAASRGAIVAAVGTIPAAVYLAPRRTKLKVIAGTICGVLLLMFLANDVFWARMNTMVTGEYGKEATPENRERIFWDGFEMFKDYPFGAGHRGFEALSPLYVETQDLASAGVRSAHNTFIATLVDQGLPGAVLFLGMNLWCIASLVRAKRSRVPLLPDEAMKRAAVGVSLAALCLAGMFDNLIKAEVQVWLLALLASLDAQRAMRPVPAELAVEDVPMEALPHPFAAATSPARRQDARA
jgi:hypothetical protein